MTPLMCTTCGVRFPVGRRTSEERYHQAATDAGWVLGWPGGRNFCPEHPPPRKET